MTRLALRLTRQIGPIVLENIYTLSDVIRVLERRYGDSYPLEITFNNDDPSYGYRTYRQQAIFRTENAVYDDYLFVPTHLPIPLNHAYLYRVSYPLRGDRTRGNIRQRDCTPALLTEEGWLQ